LCTALVGSANAASEQKISFVQHDLVVRLFPSEHRFEAEDQLSFPDATFPVGAIRFRLNAGIHVEAADSDYLIVEVEESPTAEGGSAHGGWKLGAPHRQYELRPRGGAWPKNPRPGIRFAGEIHHPVVAEREEYARSFSRSLGIIGEEGVMLSGSSLWVPSFGDEFVSFRLTVTVPEGWDVVSQGRRTLSEEEGSLRRVRWESPQPADEVYLIAARFTEYSRETKDLGTSVYLRAPDPSLADRYLGVTTQYVEMYSRLIGPYPYEKFAIVENFWETGYGMPSFTLLGPKVIRFPFILHSSLPHEILHNWWGNSVFVDSERGNWSEGLTAYLADHLVKEGRGQGVEHRRDALKTYGSYVSERRDFPIALFRSRHSSASEAIGYGKSLMVWHMLRLRLGDQKFTEGLKEFFRRYRFKRASFNDLEKTFAEVSGEDLEMFFHQWIDHDGAPMLSLKSEVIADRRLKIEVRQNQPGVHFEFTVPLAVTLENDPAAQIFPLEIKERVSEFQFDLSSAPTRVDLDPYFDVFRRLDSSETPPTLGDLFGAERVTLVLPARDPAGLVRGWKAFAHSWAEGSRGEVEMVEEEEITSLPSDRAVWVLGTGNGWRRALLPSLERYRAGLRDGEIHIGGMTLPERGHSFAYIVGHPDQADLALGWIGADAAEALPGLARKLPHYSKYSYLAFSGGEPTNVAKGKWEALESPLVQGMGEPGAPLRPRADLPERAPLARLTPGFDASRLLEHVQLLAGEALEGRGVGTAGLDEAGDYIADLFGRAGLEPGGEEGSYFQTWVEPDGPDGKPVTLRNVIGVLSGGNREWSRQSVVIGAHYDHLGRGWPDVRSGEQGKIHPGSWPRCSAESWSRNAPSFSWLSPGRSGIGEGRCTTSERWSVGRSTNRWRWSTWTAWAGWGSRRSCCSARARRPSGFTLRWVLALRRGSRQRPSWKIPEAATRRASMQRAFQPCRCSPVRIRTTTVPETAQTGSIPRAWSRLRDSWPRSRSI
jgi:hypothetical protein